MLNYTLNRKTKFKQVRRFSESPVRLITSPTSDMSSYLTSKGIGAFDLNKLNKTIATIQSMYDNGAFKKKFTYDSKITIYFNESMYIAVMGNKVVGFIIYEYNRVAVSRYSKIETTTAIIIIWKDNSVKNDLSLQKIMFERLFPLEDSILSDQAFSLEGEKNWHSFVKKSFDKGYFVYRVVGLRVVGKYSDYKEYEKDIPNNFNTSPKHSEIRILVTKSDWDIFEVLDPVHYPDNVVLEKLWS